MTTAANVLIVTGEYPPMLGGVGDYTALLAAHLARSGGRVVVLTGVQHATDCHTVRQEPHPPDSEAGPRGPFVVRTVRGWGFRSWTQVDSAARESRSQVVHLQYQAAAYAMHPAANLLPGFLRLRLPGVKLVTTFHDLRVPYLFPKAGRLRHGAVGALDALSHASVATNQADFDDLGGPGRSGLHPRRWLIPLGSSVPNSPPAGFDRAAWRRRFGTEEGTLLVSYFGFMNDTKGVEFLVQALGLLSGRGLGLRLVVVGGDPGETDPTNHGYSHRILQLIKSRHLTENVFWTGFLPPEQVSAALLCSDLCALPFRDGVSLRRSSLLAAFAHGLPIVTTLPERREPLLVDGENLAMVERDSPAALADAIEQLWRDTEARSRLSAGARALARKFEWEDIAARHLEMYEAVLS